MRNSPVKNGGRRRGVTTFVLKRSAKIGLEVVMGLVAALGIVAGLLIWRLSDGPVSIAFLTPYLEASFSDRDAGVNVGVTDTVLTWDRREGDLDLRALNVTVRDQQGRLILSLPDVEVGVSLAALLSGTLAPTRVEVVGARITLRRTADGTFQFGDGNPQDSPAEEDSGDMGAVLPDLLAQLQSDHDPGHNLSYLRELVIVDGQLVIRDEQAGVEWWAKSTNIDVKRDQVGLSGDLSLDIAEPKEISGLSGVFSYHKASERLDLVISFEEVLLSDLGLLAPGLQKLAGLDVPIKGALTSAIDSQGRITSLGFNISGGAGQLAIADLWPEPLPMRSFTGRGIFDGAKGRMQVDEAVLALGTESEPGPKVALVGSAERLEEGIVIKARASGEAIALDDLANYWPLGLSNNARYWVTQNIRDGKADTAEINLDILVPEGAKDQVRAREVFGHLTYSDLSVHYLRPLPPVTGVSGEATFSDKEFVLHPQGGRLGKIAVGTGRIHITGLDAADQVIDIDLGLGGPMREVLELLDHERLDLVSGLGIDPAKTSGQAQGQLKFVFPLLADLEIEQVDITVSADLKDTVVGDLLLDKDLSEGQLQLALDNDGMQITGPMKLGALGMTVDWKESFKADAAVQTRVKAEVPRVAVADWAAFGLTVTPYLEGPAVAWITAAVDRKGTTRVEGSADLREAKLAFPILGWNKAAGAPAAAEASLIFRQGRLDRVESFHIDAEDLDAAGAVDFDPKNASMSELRIADLKLGRTELTNVVMHEDGEMFRVDLGSGVIDLEPRLRPKSESQSGEAERQGEADSAVSDQVVIARAVQPEPEQPFDLYAKRLDRVYFGPEEYLEDVGLRLIRKPRGWDRMEIDGRVPQSLERYSARKRSAASAPAAEGAAVEPGEKAPQSNGGAKAQGPTEDQPTAEPVTLLLRLVPVEDGTRRLTVKSRDMGAVLRALDIDANIEGGKLEIEGATESPDPASPIKGYIEADKIRVYEAPILAKLLTFASLTGIVESLGGEGLVFDRVTGDFVLDGDQLSTELLRVYGTSLGITAEGNINLDSSRINMQGTVVPAYFLNRVIGWIPIIGNILIGGEGEGLIAFTYAIKGPSDDPDVSVNPLAALTPGFLRGVFNVFDEGEEPSEEDLRALPDYRNDR